MFWQIFKEEDASLYEAASHTSRNPPKIPYFDFNQVSFNNQRRSINIVAKRIRRNCCHCGKDLPANRCKRPKAFINFIFWRIIRRTNYNDLLHRNSPYVLVLPCFAISSAKKKPCFVLHYIKFSILFLSCQVF